MAKAKEKWFQKGKEGEKRAKQADAEVKARRARGDGAWRFRQDADEKTKIVFLDSPAFFLSEHSVQTGPKRWDPYTCVRDCDTCPICESGSNPGYNVVATIISTKPWTDKSGKVHKLQKCLFVAKSSARQNLLRQVERRDGDLTLCAFEIARGSLSNEPATGSDFDFIRRLTKPQSMKLILEGQDESYLKPFVYEEILKPRPVEELRVLMGTADPVGAGEGKDETDDLLGGGGDDQGTEEASNDVIDSIDDLL